MSLLEITSLHCSVAGKEILTGVDLSIGKGEVHAIMGPNGSGKSTLASVLMGSPKCSVTAGDIVFNGEGILELSADQRARKGIFLGFQHPTEIQGLKYYSFLKRAADSKASAGGEEKKSVIALKKEIDAVGAELFLPADFASREVNHGFSGGEKKRAEVLQLQLLNPKLAFLDEIDSGLDVDTLKVTAQQISAWQKKTGASLVLMTHYKRILEYISPKTVHIMVGGKIVKSGGPELAGEIDAQGYGLDNAGGAKGNADDAVAEEKEFYGSMLKLNKQKAAHEPAKKSGKIGLSVV